MCSTAIGGFCLPAIFVIFPPGLHCVILFITILKVLGQESTCSADRSLLLLVVQVGQTQDRENLQDVEQYESVEQVLHVVGVLIYWQTLP